jgi:hypothetical protein
MYALLISFATAGRLFGGLMHYVVKIPTHLRFKVAAIVYFSLNIISGILLFTNYYFMIALQFLMGLLSINSFQYPDVLGSKLCTFGKKGSGQWCFSNRRILGDAFRPLAGGQSG